MEELHNTSMETRKNSTSTSCVYCPSPPKSSQTGASLRFPKLAPNWNLYNLNTMVLSNSVQCQALTKCPPKSNLLSLPSKTYGKHHLTIPSIQNPDPLNNRLKNRLNDQCKTLPHWIYQSHICSEPSEGVKSMTQRYRLNDVTTDL